MLAARESLRYTEQQVLLQALTDYMDVLRDTAILDLNKNNVDVLKEQLRQTKDRFNVGEVTRTDVAQAEASLAGAQAQYLTAAIDPAGLDGALSAGDRRRSEEPGAGFANFEAVAENRPRGGLDLAGGESRR